jgi:carbonic anhydrase
MTVAEFSTFLERNEDHAQHFENERFDSVQTGQSPEFVTVCCSDSRVLQDELCENREPGHVFTCGNIGNRVVENTADGMSVSGDVLYPLAHTGTENVVVIGHTGCGAVTATYEDATSGIEEPAGIRHCVDLLKTQLTDGIEMLPDDLDGSEAINRLVEYNVDRQVEFLLDSDDVHSEVDVLGAVYDFQNVYSDERGRLHVVNVNGEIERSRIEEEHSDLAERMNRLWTY